jgi:hypothetical protein
MLTVYLYAGLLQWGWSRALNHNKPTHTTSFQPFFFNEEFFRRTSD